MRKIMAALLGGAVLLSLAGCPAEPSSSGATGTVVKRETQRARNGPSYHLITVREDGTGRRSKGRVSQTTWRRCTVGERWPVCKRG